MPQIFKIGSYVVYFWQMRENHLNLFMCMLQ
jgi:hypothetical protein